MVNMALAKSGTAASATPSAAKRTAGAKEGTDHRVGRDGAVGAAEIGVHNPVDGLQEKQQDRPADDAQEATAISRRGERVYTDMIWGQGDDTYWTSVQEKLRWSAGGAAT